MITVSDTAAIVLVIFCIGATGAFVGGLLAEGVIRLLIYFGWLAKRVVVVRIVVTEDQVADAGRPA